MKDSSSLTGAPDDSVLGFAALIETFDGNSEAVLALLRTATASIASDVQRIEAAALAGDAATVAEATHKLKGTSGCLSAKRLSAAVSSLERASPQTSMSAELPLIVELKAAVDTVSAAVEGFASFARSSAEAK